MPANVLRMMAAATWFVLGIGLLTGAAQAQSLKYVPESTSIAIQLRPKAALAEPALMFMPRELLEVFGKKEMGLDLLEVERLLLVVDRIETFQTPEPPGVALIAEFASPQTIGGRLADDITAMEMNGQKVWRMEDQLELRQVNPQTIVIGIPEWVSEVVASNNPSGALGKALLASGADEQMTMVFDIKSLRPAIAEAMPPRDEVPPPVQALIDIPEMVSQLTVRHSWRIGGSSELRLTAESAAEADKLERTLRGSINNLRQLVLAGVLSEMQLPDEDYQQAMVRFVERIAEELKSGLAAARSENDLVIDLAKTPQLSSTAVSGVLVGLLLPAVQSAREAARRADSMNRLRQLMLAAQNYHDATGALPGQAIKDAEGKPLLSWRVAILPYLEEGELYSQFHLDEPWDSEHNLKLLDQMPDSYRSANLDLGNKTVYLAVTGEGTSFEAGKKVRFAQIFDGTSNTIGMLEVNPERAVPWTKPEDWTYVPGRERDGLGGLRPNGFNAALMDGSIRFIANTIDPEVLRALFLINDGRVINELDFDR